MATRKKYFYKIEGCGKPGMGQGLCSMHYSRLRRNGDVHCKGLSPLKERDPAQYAAARALTIAGRRTEASRAKTAQRLKEQWAALTPEARAQRVAAMHQISHSPEQIERLRQRRQTPEARAKTANITRRIWAEHDEDMRQSRIKPMLEANLSSLERTVALLLDSLGLAYITQKKFGRYFVDFFVPAQRLIIECDGRYWHSLPERREHDKKRDAYFIAHGYRVLHLPEEAIRSGAYISLLHEAF